MWKIISQHFSAEDFETSVNMVKENFKVFLQVINATIIGEKQILKMLHDYFYLIIDYVSIKTHDSGSSIMLMALNMFFSNRGCNQVFNASIKDAMMCLNFLEFTSVVISKTPSRSCPWKLKSYCFHFHELLKFETLLWYLFGQLKLFQNVACCFKNVAAMKSITPISV